MEEELRKCPFCAEEIRPLAVLCKHCGSAITNPQVQAQPTPIAYTQSSGVLEGERQKSGLAISSLILGVIALVISFLDIGLVTSGDYAYIRDDEIGIIAILAFTSLGLGIGAARKNQKYGKAALWVAIAAVLIMFVAASYTF